jgi:hypothetical protein
LQPHPESKVLHIGDSSLVGIACIQLIIDVWKEDGLVVVSFNVPPGSEVVAWGAPLLDERDLSQVSKDEIDNRTPPSVTLLIHSHTLVRSSKCVQRVHIETSTLFNNCSSNEASLGNANDTDLLSCEVWIIMNLVACLLSLPCHSLKDRCDFSIANLHTFDHSSVVNAS